MLKRAAQNAKNANTVEKRRARFLYCVRMSEKRLRECIKMKNDESMQEFMYYVKDRVAAYIATAFKKQVSYSTVGNMLAIAIVTSDPVPLMFKFEVLPRQHTLLDEDERVKTEFQVHREFTHRIVSFMFGVLSHDVGDDFDDPVGVIELRHHWRKEMQRAVDQLLWSDRVVMEEAIDATEMWRSSTSYCEDAFKNAYYYTYNVTFNKNHFIAAIAAAANE